MLIATWPYPWAFSNDVSEPSLTPLYAHASNNHKAPGEREMVDLGLGDNYVQGPAKSTETVELVRP